MGRIGQADDERLLDKPRSQDLAEGETSQYCAYRQREGERLWDCLYNFVLLLQEKLREGEG